MIFSKFEFFVSWCRNISGNLIAVKRRKIFFDSPFNGAVAPQKRGCWVNTLGDINPQKWHNTKNSVNDVFGSFSQSISRRSIGNR